MKNLKGILLLAAISLVSFKMASQSALDQKNGFKEFTLGDPFYKWGTSLVYRNTLQSGIKVYKYVGVCCRTVYGYTIDEIRLGFDSQNSLTVIWFTTEKFQKGYDVDKKYTQWNGTRDFDKIKARLESQFGESDGVDKDDSTGNVTLFWLGNKVMLTLEYEYLGVSNGDRCNILVGKYDKSQTTDGF